MEGTVSPIASNGVPVWSAQDKKSFSYWTIVIPYLQKSFDQVAADQVYGKKDCKDLGLLQLFHQLHKYLNVIYEDREAFVNENDTTSLIATT